MATMEPLFLFLYLFLNFHRENARPFSPFYSVKRGGVGLQTDEQLAARDQ